MAESVGEELHFTFVDEDDDLVLEKCGKCDRESNFSTDVRFTSETSEHDNSDEEKEQKTSKLKPDAPSTSKKVPDKSVQNKQSTKKKATVRKKAVVASNTSSTDN